MIIILPLNKPSHFFIKHSRAQEAWDESKHTRDELGRFARQTVVPAIATARQEAYEAIQKMELEAAMMNMEMSLAGQRRDRILNAIENYVEDVFKQYWDFVDNYAKSLGMTTKQYKAQFLVPFVKPKSELQVRDVTRAVAVSVESKAFAIGAVVAVSGSRIADVAAPRIEQGRNAVSNLFRRR